MKQINLGVIGCGRIGKMHVDNIINGFSTVKIKTIVDNHLDPQWAYERNINNVCDNIDAILQDDSIDAVFIAASSSAHVDLIKQAAMAGKDIFCEKPIAFELDKIQSAIDAVNAAGVKFQVGFNRRFDPDFAKINEAIQAGTIGIIHTVKITNHDPKRPDLSFIPKSGGLVFDFNIHDFDTIRYITGEEVEEVYATGAVLIDQKIKELGDIDTICDSIDFKKWCFVHHR